MLALAKGVTCSSNPDDASHFAKEYLTRKAPLFLSLSALVISVLVQQPYDAMACPTGGCTNASFYGDYALSATSNGASPNIAIAGVLHADGAGGLTGEQTNVDDSVNPVNVVTVYICNSTYSINANGTGTASLNIYTDAGCTIGPVATPTLALVLEDGGRSLRSLNTNGVLRHKRQRPLAMS